MHHSVSLWFRENRHLLAAPVLDIGSYDVNGTVREWCPTPYVGIDIQTGPNVDIVYDGHTLPFADQSQGTVVCLEVFEHAANPNRLAAEIVRVLVPGGYALVTARGVGFQYHNPPDRWRFMPGALSELFAAYGCETTEIPDPQAAGWFVTAQK